MAEQSTRLETTRQETTAGAPKTPAAEVNRLRTEIEDARDGLGFYVTELDRRRHESLDLKLQLRKHKLLAIAVGVATVSAAAGAVAGVVRSRRKAARVSPAPLGRMAPSVAQKSRRVGKFLLGAAVPVALKAARGIVERAGSHRPRMA